MAGIPSIGDILMLSQLAWKIGRAFAAGRKGAPTEFLEIETEINGLAKALKLLAESLFADADDSVLKKGDKDTQNGVATILTSCQRTVQDLDSLMDQYQVIKKHRTTGGFAIERSWSELVLSQYKTMMWTTDGGNIQNLRTILEMQKSTVALIMQALQSKSLSRLESIVAPMAEQMDGIYHRTGSLDEQLEEVHRVLAQMAGRTPSIRATHAFESRPPSSLKLDMSQPATPSSDAFSAQQYFPPRQNSKRQVPSRVPPSWSPSLGVPSNSSSSRPNSPTDSETETYRKRISDFSFGASTSRYSDSFASSDAESTGWPSPSTNRNSLVSRQPSKTQSTLATTPEIREPRSRPDSSVLPGLPPPAIDIPDNSIEKVMSFSKLKLHPPTQPEYTKLHRSSTTSSQKDLFEKQAFRNSAILCDVRGTLVEYTQKVSSDADTHDVEMVEACTDCRIAIVRKREPNPDTKEIRIMTSIWAFSDDNTVRLQLTMDDGEMYVPYSSYFSPEKISVTVACELKYHDIKFGSRPVKTAKTTWVNYIFENAKGAILFQNELMGRTLLGTFRTEKTMRIHEGLSAAFTYAEQMCALENLRIWEDDETGAVIAMIHFSAHFRPGYFAFYLNSASNPIRVKDEGGKEVKIKGLRVPLDKEKKTSRKDSVVTTKDVAKAEKDSKKWITGAKIEFATEEERREFVELVRNVQRGLVDLPELLGVN